MTAQPFRPFRLCMTKGKLYDITNHDAAFVTRQFVEVGVEVDAKGIAGSVDRCAILHITRIENIPAVAA